MFGCKFRTNNFVESHNARLAVNLPNRSSFYEFAEGLIKEENRKQHEFSLVLDGHDMVFQKMRKNAITKAKRIVRAGELLTSKKLTMDGYMRQLVSMHTKIVLDDVGAAELVDDEETDDADEDDEAADDDAADMLCILCKTRERNTFFAVCMHLSACTECTYARRFVGLDMSCPMCHVESPTTKEIRMK